MNQLFIFALVVIFNCVAWAQQSPQVEENVFESKSDSQVDLSETQDSEALDIDDFEEDGEASKESSTEEPTEESTEDFAEEEDPATDELNEDEFEQEDESFASDEATEDSEPLVEVESEFNEASAAQQAFEDDASSRSGPRKAFDLNAVRRQNPTKSQRVPHPFAKKGLKRITKDNLYIYETKKSKREHSTTFLLSNFQPTSFDGSAEYSGSNTTFDEIYDDSVMLTIDYEWPMLNLFFGEIGLKVGSGIMTTKGTGIFERDGTASSEELTLFMMPNTAGAILKLRWTDDQLLVPYAEAGGGFYFLTEYQNEADQFRFDGAATVYFAGGIALNVGRISRESLFTMDREHGVNGLLFNLEFRVVEGTSPYNIAYNAFSAGFTFEY